MDELAELVVLKDFVRKIFDHRDFYVHVDDKPYVLKDGSPGWVSLCIDGNCQITPEMWIVVQNVLGPKWKYL